LRKPQKTFAAKRRRRRRRGRSKPEFNVKTHRLPSKSTAHNLTNKFVAVCNSIVCLFFFSFLFFWFVRHDQLDEQSSTKFFQSNRLRDRGIDLNPEHANKQIEENQQSQAQTTSVPLKQIDRSICFRGRFFCYSQTKILLCGL